MNLRARWVGWALFAALGFGLTGVREADAKGSRGGHHSSGRSSRPPRVSAPRHVSRPSTHKAPAPKPAKKPHVAAPARANVARTTKPKTVQPHAKTAQAVASRAASTSATSTTSATNSGRTYTYGAGTQARRFKAHGYGRGYRNRYVGGRRGYGRSQGNNRAIVSRLRSVHSSLSRLDHNYNGHRVSAMHSVSMAIRQLSHRSMVYRGAGFSNSLNTGRTRTGVGTTGRRTQHLTQAQSDARMSTALRTLQGIGMQLTNQGYQTSGQSRARGHVQRATFHLNTALSIR